MRRPETGEARCLGSPASLAALHSGVGPFWSSCRRSTDRSSGRNQKYGTRRLLQHGVRNAAQLDRVLTFQAAAAMRHHHDEVAALLFRGIEYGLHR